ncbi:macrophage mannose receptor 1 [Fusarium globosum]|uniref:Macrophage mannose receptor 1 n=1 Tax=Fusarium globosum TaxID=78864 RepID=A0A8H5Y5W2_9HYPO|nr:macrophage mannose receptor 1 [Fusarium globosum]
MSPNVRDGLGWTLSVWDLWRKGTYGRISRRRRREALLSDAKGDAASCAQELERIEGEEQRDREALERATELAEKADKSDSERSPQDQEELDRRFNLLTCTWFGHNYLAHKYGFEPRVKVSKLRPPPATVPKAGGTGDDTGTHRREAVAQSSATTPQPARGTLGGEEIQRTSFGGRSAIFGVSPCAALPHPEGTLRRTCGGRITKNSTQAEVSPQTASQRHDRQRKTYKKERASRRLAKLEREYGTLEDARRR